MRVLKFLWFHAVMTATGWLPDLRPVLKLRGFLLQPAFRKCGANLQAARRVTINFTNRMEIGRDVFFATGCWLNAAGGIVLEDGVQIGPYAVIASADHTIDHDSYRFGKASLAPVRICNGSWIGAHATVTKGVAIGPGALLAANSVATRDVPPFAKYGGVPAVPIGADTRTGMLR